MNRIFSGFILIASVLAPNQEVRSQDYSNFVQFYLNPSLINPSFTGIDGQPAAFLAYKRQWMGVKGTPSIGHFSIQSPSGSSKLGFGLNAGNDTRGLLSSTTLGLAVSYYALITDETYLRFGFSIGAGWNKVDVNSLVFGSTSDAIMNDLLNSNIQLRGSAGLSFQAKTFQIGAAIPNIFQPSYLTTDAFTVSEVKPFETIVFHTSNRFYFARDQHSFEPYLVYRLNSSRPSQLEAAGVVHLKNMVWFGASYKQNFGISGLIGFKLTKLAALGYSYSLKNTGLNELGRPSHEIQLGLLFGTHQKKTPVYSFVNAEKEKRRLTTQERLQALAKARPKNPTPPKGKNNQTTTPNNNVSRPRNSTTTIPGLTTTPNNTEKNNQTTNPTTTNPVTNNQTTNPTTTNPVTNNQATNPTTTNPVTNNQTTNPTTTNPVTNNQTTNPTTTNPVTNNQTTNPTTTNPVTNNQTTNPTTTNPVTNNQTTNPTTTNPVTTNPTTNPSTEPEGSIVERPAKFASEADSIQHQEEVDKLNRLEEHTGDPDAEHNEAGHPHAERHEFVLRGNHEKEMDLGDYVIVGVFRSEVNAKHMTDELRKLGFSEVDYGYLTNKAVWYIHIADSDDIEEAKAKRNKYRKMKMFKDAWLLTVHQ